MALATAVARSSNQHEIFHNFMFSITQTVLAVSFSSIFCIAGALKEPLVYAFWGRLHAPGMHLTKLELALFLRKFIQKINLFLLHLRVDNRKIIETLTSQFMGIGISSTSSMSSSRSFLCNLYIFVSVLSTSNFNFLCTSRDLEKELVNQIGDSLSNCHKCRDTS